MCTISYVLSPGQYHGHLFSAVFSSAFLSAPFQKLHTATLDRLVVQRPKQEMGIRDGTKIALKIPILRAMLIVYTQKR